jgi:hypothetical protein
MFVSRRLIHSRKNFRCEIILSNLGKLKSSTDYNIRLDLRLLQVKMKYSRNKCLARWNLKH